MVDEKCCSAFVLLYWVHTAYRKAGSGFAQSFTATRCMLPRRSRLPWDGGKIAWSSRSKLCFLTKLTRSKDQQTSRRSQTIGLAGKRPDFYVYVEAILIRVAVRLNLHGRQNGRQIALLGAKPNFSDRDYVKRTHRLTQPTFPPWNYILNKK